MEQEIFKRLKSEVIQGHVELREKIDELIVQIQNTTNEYELLAVMMDNELIRHKNTLFGKEVD